MSFPVALVGDSRHRTPLSREQHSGARPLPLLLHSGAVPSTGAASRGCLRAESREPHPAARSPHGQSQAPRHGRARGSAAPRPALRTPPRGRAPVPQCRRGSLEGGRSEGTVPLLPTAPPGTARCPSDGRSPLAPPGRWRDAGSGKGRGWKSPPSLRIRVVVPGTAGPPEPVPGEDGVSRAAGTRRLLPGRGERGWGPRGWGRRSEGAA